MRQLRWAAVGLAAVLTLAGCRPDRGDTPAGDAGKRPGPLVGKVKAEVQPDIDRYLAEAHARTLKELEKGKDFPALFKVPARVKAITDPWGGLADVEQTGLDLAGASSGGMAKLPAVLDAMAALLGKPVGEEAKVERGKLVTLDDHATYWVAVLDRAKGQQDAAFAKLKPEDRKFLFEWPHSLLPNFGPMAFLDDKTERQLKNDRSFCALAAEQVDWAKLVGSARTLAALADADYLAELAKVLEKAEPIKETVPGVRSGIEAFVRHEPCDPLDYFRGWKVLRCAVRRDGLPGGSNPAFPEGSAYRVDGYNLAELDLADDVAYDEACQRELMSLGAALGKPGPPDVFFLWENSD
jgi:hypothetical protein